MSLCAVLSARLQGEESSSSVNGSGGLALRIQLKVYASTC